MCLGESSSNESTLTVHPNAKLQKSSRKGKRRGQPKSRRKEVQGPPAAEAVASRPAQVPVPEVVQDPDFESSYVPGMSKNYQPPGKRKVRAKGKALDLFSGTGSVARRLTELGYEVISLDIDPRCSATFVTDIFDWIYTGYHPGYFKIIAASVPCAEYSIAKTTAPRDFHRADALVTRVLEIVNYLEPKIWWIENPRTGHLKNRDMVKKLPFVDLDYCQFSDWGYQKPTRFWGSENLGKLKHVTCPGRACKNVVQDAEGVRHKEKLGGNNMKFNTTEKGRIPPTIIDYLLQEGEYAPSKWKKPNVNVRVKGYKVHPKIRTELLQKLGVDRDHIKIDVFASPADAQEKLFMSEQNSAWCYDWHKLSANGGILWANPPFNELRKTVVKACLEPCRMVLVAPAWKKGDWKEILAKITVKQEFFEPHQPIFERNKDHGLLAGRHWGVHIYFLDTTKVTVPRGELDPLMVEEVESDSLGWGIDELNSEMQKTPQPVVKSGVKEVDEARKVVIDRVRSDKDLRLIMSVYARLPSGRGQTLQILIDTGAEANLIKEGLVLPNEFRSTTNWLCLTTANGQTLRGGRKVLETDLVFRKKIGPKGKMGNFCVGAKFYEADINVDVILGHPWLKSQKIGVFPHMEALALNKDGDRVEWLWGSEKPIVRKKRHRFEYAPRRRTNNVQVNRVSARVGQVDEVDDFDDEEMKNWVRNIHLELPHIDSKGRTYHLTAQEKNVCKNEFTHVIMMLRCIAL